MLILVTYDVNTQDKGGRTRLRKVAKQCVNYGHRVQNSVFECVVDAATFEILKNSLVDIIDFDKDSLRFYRLGNNYKNKVEHFGLNESLDIEGTLFI